MTRNVPCLKRVEEMEYSEDFEFQEGDWVGTHSENKKEKFQEIESSEKLFSQSVLQSKKTFEQSKEIIETEKQSEINVTPHVDDIPDMEDFEIEDPAALLTVKPLKLLGETETDTILKTR
jgi:hypothetical protein